MSYFYQWSQVALQKWKIIISCFVERKIISNQPWDSSFFFQFLVRLKLTFACSNFLFHCFSSSTRALFSLLSALNRAESTVFDEYSFSKLFSKFSSIFRMFSTSRQAETSGTSIKKFLCLLWKEGVFEVFCRNAAFAYLGQAEILRRWVTRANRTNLKCAREG